MRVRVLLKASGFPQGRKVRVTLTAEGGVGEGGWGRGVASSWPPRVGVRKSVRVRTSAEHLPCLKRFASVDFQCANVGPILTLSVGCLSKSQIGPRCSPALRPCLAPHTLPDLCPGHGVCPPPLSCPYPACSASFPPSGQRLPSWASGLRQPLWGHSLSPSLLG